VIWQLMIGLVLMLAGGEGLVRGAVALAERLGMSPLVVGVVLVGFGTSAPELATCIDAALTGAPGIAIGNIVGSNIANVLLILAVGALLFPIAAEPQALRRDGPVLLASALICTAIVLGGHIGRGLGTTLLLGLIGYLVVTTWNDRSQGASAADMETKPPLKIGVLAGDLAMAIGGLLAVLFGAHLLVGSAVDLAGRLGVSEAVIGLTLVAVGTSLPELATAVMASMKRQGALVFGNVIGSNIFNSLGILGTTAMVQPIDMPPGLALFDIWVMLGATAALLLFAVTHWRVSRREGAVLLMGYVAYLGMHGGLFSV